MADTTLFMNFTSNDTTTLAARTLKKKKCIVGNERVYKQTPPEVLVHLTSFHERKVVHKDEMAAKVTFYVLVMLLDIVGNSLIIFIVAASKKMRTPTNVLLLNLAIADLLICMLCMWVHLGDSITEEWPFGVGICKINMFAQITLITTSVLTLTAISVERFFAIVFPLRRTWTLRLTACIIVVIWLIACGIASPQLAVRYVQDFRFKDHHSIRCREEWPEIYKTVDCETWKPSEMVYHVFVSLVMFVVPIVVMIVCYTVICISLLTRKAPGGRSASDSHSRSKRKVVRMLVILVVVFILCWTPAHVIELIPFFDKDYKVSGAISYTALFVAYLNSALNPILYAGFNDNFRRGFQEVFSCSCFPFKHVSGRVRPESRRSPTGTAHSPPGRKLNSHSQAPPGPRPPPPVFTAQPPASPGNKDDDDNKENGPGNGNCQPLQDNPSAFPPPSATVTATTSFTTVT